MWVSDFCGEPVLWITEPSQRDMELMKFVGGYPNEYCIYVNDMPEIKQLETLINKLNLPQYTRFKTLGNTDDYFNQFGLCGVCAENGKWVWCHQGFVESGDNPAIAFFRKAYVSLEELVDNITDELLRKYKQTPKDEAFAHLSGVIIGAYNGSYKPHLMDFASGLQHERTKHTPAGYCLVFINTERGYHSYIKVSDKKLSDYIPHVFIVNGKVSVEWDDIISSKAVQKALEKEYGSDTLVVRYYEYHEKYGDCLVCAELIGETWQDGYYTFDERGTLIKKGEAR